MKSLPSMFLILRRSLRVKVTLGIVLPLFVILGTFSWIEYGRHRSAVFAELSLLASYSGQVIENNLRHEMLEADFAGVQGLLDTIGENENFRVVYLLNPAGQVIFAPRGQDRGKFLDNEQPDCQPCHRLPADERPASIVVTADDGQRVFRSMLPIENHPACNRCHDPAQRLLGLVLSDIPTASVEKPLAADFRENLLWWAGTILVTVFIVNLAMSRLVITRLEGVAKTLGRFGKGQLGIRLPADNPDEIGRLAVAFNEMGNNIQSEEAKNRQLSAEVRTQSTRQQDLLKRLISAQEDERRNVAHDLHDGIGQDLAGLAVSLQGIEQLWSDPPEPVRRHLLQVRKRIAEMTERAYEMIINLRPTALDDLGLVPALRAHAERVLKDSDIPFTLEAGELKDRLPGETEITLFRIIQEALNNIVRHAQASRVRISLAVVDGVLEGEVVDDGRGFEPESVPVDGSGPRGLGLLGMQERSSLCGGTLAILSRPGAGTRIRIRIPLSEENDG